MYLTHRVQEDREEELSSIDELVQFVWAAWVILIEDSVCEQTTRLTGQHLRCKSENSLEGKKGGEGEGKKKNDSRTDMYKLNERKKHLLPNQHTSGPLECGAVSTPHIVCFQ